MLDTAKKDGADWMFYGTNTAENLGVYFGHRFGENKSWLKGVVSGDYQKYYDQMYGNR